MSKSAGATDLPLRESQLEPPAGPRGRGSGLKDLETATSMRGFSQLGPSQRCLLRSKGASRDDALRREGSKILGPLQRPLLAAGRRLRPASEP